MKPDSNNDFSAAQTANGSAPSSQSPINGNAAMPSIKLTFEVDPNVRILDIPAWIMSIGDRYFYGWKSLENVRGKGGKFTAIGKEAFSECTSLRSVTNPDSVTTIGDRAFAGCNSLERLTMHESLRTIGNEAFSGCTSLDLGLIPDSVCTIGDRAFSGCVSMADFMAGDSLTSIGNGAFSGCSSMRFFSADLSSLTTIGEHAFSGCTSLSIISLPSSVTDIAENAFAGCDTLHSIGIPEGTREKFKALLPGLAAKLYEIHPDTPPQPKKGWRKLWPFKR